MGEGVCVVRTCRNKDLGLQDLFLLKDLRISFQCSRCQQTFSAKGQTVTILGFEGRAVSVQVVQMCHYIVNTVIHDTRTNEYCHGPRKLHKNRR